MRAHLVLSVMTLVACSPGPGALQPGEQVYAEPLADGNSFACATCHALSEPSADGLRRAGHALAGATRRPTFKNGQATSLLEAVNSCVTEWQGAAGWSPNEPRFVALRAFLEAEAPGDGSALSFAAVPPPGDVSGGDASAGRGLFNTSCALCHGVDGAGSIRGPNLAGARLAPSLIASRVRTSGSSTSAVYRGLTGGRMPFWAADRLSDDELRDLTAFVSTAEVPDGGLYIPDAGNSGLDGGPACGRTHPRVGWFTDLTTRAHGVRGRATLTDDCTVTLTGFNYDGNGIDVRLYGTAATDFSAGFGFGPQLYRPGQAYSDEMLVVRLPAGRSLDGLAAISVWCVAARVSFGDGTFHAP